MIENFEVISVATGLFSGSLLGGIYFGGLWWTISRLSQARRPLMLYFASLVLRMASVLYVFYAELKYAGWPAAVATMVGFLLVRLALIRYIDRGPAPAQIPRELV